jgi:hypothetical protein
LTAQAKLIALDLEDLAVISAHVQNASVRAGDIIWRQSEKRLVIGMSRLDRDQALGGSDGEPERLLSALRFERVMACKSRSIDIERQDAALDMVGIEFHPGDEPSGIVLLLFEGGGAIRLDVECLECELANLGEDDLGTTEIEADPASNAPGA